VTVNRCYNGYSWAKLPLIKEVAVTTGKELQEIWMWSGKLVCMDALKITVKTSDGQSWTSQVCMAIRRIESDKQHSWCDDEVLVTPAAKELDASDIWFHLGGWYDEGDTFDTQLSQFEDELERFWAQLIGPDESLRRAIVGTLERLSGWKAVTALANGTVRISFNDGPEKHIKPPPTPSAS